MTKRGKPVIAFVRDFPAGPGWGVWLEEGAHPITIQPHLHGAVEFVLTNGARTYAHPDPVVLLR